MCTVLELRTSEVIPLLDSLDLDEPQIRAPGTAPLAAAHLHADLFLAGLRTEPTPPLSAPALELADLHQINDHQAHYDARIATVDDVARLASGLPAVTEGARYGQRTWFVGGKGFAWERLFSKADITRFGDAPVPGGSILAVRVFERAEKEAVLASRIAGRSRHTRRRRRSPRLRRARRSARHAPWFDPPAHPTV